ncbi:MAG TPA: AAA family ATPase [Candidatus Nanoarchaeia archaeon]|nr:AAA family ATPase [Candidatus Nanoarchaeia archaeon]
MFKDILGSGESVFRDPIALDYDYLPKLVPFREQQQRQISLCIRPLVDKRNGRNLFIHGPPGVGKTVVCRHLLKALEDEEIEGVEPIYINCWKKDTSFKIIIEICERLGYRFTQNKKGEELFKIVKDLLNKKSAVFVLDEVDKLQEQDFLYSLLEEIYRKSVIMITNNKEWIAELDQRIKSRLTAELMEFRPYNREETIGVMRQRLEHSFSAGAWEEEAFLLAANKAYELHDIRLGLYLLREAGNAAEDEASRKITKQHAERAIAKLDEFNVKKKEELDEEARFILGVIKNHSGKKIGDIFREYEKEGGKSVYKTFQRKVNYLAENKFITTEKVVGGSEGTTTIIQHMGTMKKLTEF